MKFYFINLVLFFLNSVFFYSKSKIKAIMTQREESYYDNAITGIWENLLEMSTQLNQIKVQKSTALNVISEFLTVWPKYLSKRPQIFQPQQKINKNLIISKWERRWEILNGHKYKHTVGKICKAELRKMSLHLTSYNLTTRRCLS